MTCARQPDVAAGAGVGVVVGVTVCVILRKRSCYQMAMPQEGFPASGCRQLT